MGAKRSFGAGLIAGFLFVGAAGWAANVLPWTKSTVVQANSLFGPRSGFSFVLEPPPDPDTQLLQMKATTDPAIGQSVLVQTPATRQLPPDPCFTATIATSGQVVMAVADQHGFAIEDTTGAPLHFCAAN